MITQHHHKLNWLNNNVSASDGTALCVIALACYRLGIEMTPRMVRHTLRRWKKHNIVNARLAVRDYPAAHDDLGMVLMPAGSSGPKWRLGCGELAYAFFANATETAVHCVLMDEVGEVIYDPLGSDPLARGGWLVGLRIFRIPGRDPGKE